jgi:hypothetical protein
MAMKRRSVPASLPCPAMAPPGVSAAGRQRLGVRRCLFLLGRDDQLIGAIDRGQMLDQDAAQALWSAYPWQPVVPDQPWPVRTITTPDPDQGLQPMWEPSTTAESSALDTTQ